MSNSATLKYDRPFNTPIKSPNNVGDQFSPVNVPSGRSPIKGRLTGDARKVKDNIADIYNYTQKWKKSVIDGSRYIGKISEILLDNPECSKSEESLKELIQLTTCLQEVLKRLENCVNKFQLLNQSLKGIEQLELFQNDGSFVEQPLFQTWTIDEFREQLEQLLGMYEKEIQLKQMIVKNLCHSSYEKEQFIYYASSWIHEPYIELNHDFILDSMLVESGHK